LERKKEVEVKRVIFHRVSQDKDLGLTINESLNFEDHIIEYVKKANQTMGLIRSFSYLHGHPKF